LTNEIERKAKEIMDQVDAMGGSVEAIENGYMQEQIAKSAYAYQRAIESGEKVIVGLNKFTIDQADHIPVFRIDSSIQLAQIEKLRAFKKNRDSETVIRCLAAVKAAAVDGSNLMPSVVAAVEAHCTLGEISDQLRSVFGEYR
jgi:methylmalonyl-CoA mutase N-terminal domain/subunit